MPVLKKNQEITLTIDGYTSDGAGVGKVDGMAVFVPGTIAGEQVTAHIIKVNKTYAVGKLLTVLLPSPRRVTHQPVPTTANVAVAVFST